MSANSVTVAWRRDVEGGLQEARQQQRNVLLDFSAAPM
jgi:hypothetical protein